MASYRIGFGRRVIAKTSVKGKLVVELGSDRALELAGFFSQHGATVVATNMERWGEGNDSIDVMPTKAGEAQIAVRVADARTLSAAFEPASVDMVVSVALLEHLQDFSIAMEEIHRVLKPGGIACLQGNPIWSSWNGHHVWVDCENRAFRFNDPALNPLPDWGHLAYDQEELAAIMARDELTDNQIRAIFALVFESDLINRMGTIEMMEAIFGSLFRTGATVIETSSLRLPDPTLLDRLKHRTRKDQRFDVSEVYAFLRKA